MAKISKTSDAAIAVARCVSKHPVTGQRCQLQVTHERPHALAPFVAGRRGRKGALVQAWQRWTIRDHWEQSAGTEWLPWVCMGAKE
jgi:hypothetical protein